MEQLSLSQPWVSLPTCVTQRPHKYFHLSPPLSTAMIFTLPILLRAHPRKLKFPETMHISLPLQKSPLKAQSRWKWTQLWDVGLMSSMSLSLCCPQAGLDNSSHGLLEAPGRKNGALQAHAMERAAGTPKAGQAHRERPLTSGELGCIG